MKRSTHQVAKIKGLKNRSLLQRLHSFSFFVANYKSTARGLSKNVSNVIDLYHNKEIEAVLVKPEISLNRVKTK